MTTALPALEQSRYSRARCERSLSRNRPLDV
jgi:hypothetical protein